MAGPTQDFWQERFATGTTPWNRGAPNPQLARWIADGTLASGMAVIVPGCGHGWEVAALAKAGMHVTGIDFAHNALAICRQILDSDGCTAKLVDADVLHWQPDTPVDAVFEQTCLCALYPDFWQRYATQLHTWLKPGGKLLALFLQALRPEATHGFIDGPPYHCDINAMRALFPEKAWIWPKPPYAQVDHPNLSHELALRLVRR